MFNNEAKEMRLLEKSQEVSLGDGRFLETTAEGTVSLLMLILDRNRNAAFCVMRS